MRQAASRWCFWLSVLVAVGLVATACQAGVGATSQPPPTGGAPTKPATTEAAPRPAASKGTLKLGMLLAMTGSESFYGQVTRGACTR